VQTLRGAAIRCHLSDISRREHRFHILDNHISALPGPPDLANPAAPDSLMTIFTVSRLGYAGAVPFLVHMPHHDR
jgi:hypothetical protein